MSSLLLSPFKYASRVLSGANESSDSRLLSKSIVTAPSPASTDEATEVSHGSNVLVDLTTDYRGFLFVVHETHGLMLLHCTRKKNKGPHFQLPGGHIDENEFVSACKYPLVVSSVVDVAVHCSQVKSYYV